MKKSNKKGRARKRQAKPSKPRKRGVKEDHLLVDDSPKRLGPLEKKEVQKEVQKRVVDKKPSTGSKGIGGIVQKGIQFLREAKNELKKVKWPTRKELMASTAVVILLVLVIAFYLGLVDFGLIKIIKNLVG